MRKLSEKALLAVALGVVLAACGGPEDGTADDFGAGGEALTVSATAQGATAAATQAAAQGTTIVVAIPAGGRTPDGTPLIGTAYVPVQTAGYLVNGDSSPDPIPARNAADLIEARPRVISLADCERMTDAKGRANCFQMLARGGF